MPVYCCVKTCHNNSISNPTCSFFQLPQNDKRRSKWLVFAGYDSNHDKRIQICIDHFEKKFVWKRHPRPLLTRDAIPTIKERSVSIKEETLDCKYTLPRSSDIALSAVKSHQSTAENEQRLTERIQESPEDNGLEALDLKLRINVKRENDNPRIRTEKQRYKRRIKNTLNNLEVLDTFSSLETLKMLLQQKKVVRKFVIKS